MKQINTHTYQGFMWGRKETKLSEWTWGVGFRGAGWYFLWDCVREVSLIWGKTWRKLRNKQLCCLEKSIPHKANSKPKVGAHLVCLKNDTATNNAGQKMSKTASGSERPWSRTQESNSTPPLDANCKRFIGYTGACGCISLCGLSVPG